MKITFGSNERGAALLLSLIVFVTMALLIGAMAVRVTNQTHQITAYTNFQDSLEGVEAAFALARIELSKMGDDSVPLSERDGFVGLSPYVNVNLAPPTFDDAAVVPETIPGMPYVEFFAYTRDWASDGIDNNGNGFADEFDEGGYYTIFSFARAPGVVRRWEMVLHGTNENIWNNAIFAGSGEVDVAGRREVIFGKINVYGSVHLLGDDLMPGDVAMSILEASGKATKSLIHNNYRGMSKDIRNRVPALPVRIFEGDSVETLNATLRVKRGSVAVFGNGEIGEEQKGGNGFKETMDGAYVSDGWSGNLDGDGNPVNVWADNGFEEPYDLGETVDFPTYTDDRGVIHLDYYLETATNANEGLHYIHEGDIALIVGEPYYWNATTEEEAVGLSPGYGPMPRNAEDVNEDDYFVWFDGENLFINGRIPVDGNLSFQGDKNKDVITYTGKGTMLAYDSDLSGDGGNVILDVHLVTPSVKDPSKGDPPTFPNENLIGIMAERRMEISATGRHTIMGGFYAQENIEILNKTTVLSTIVADWFNITDGEIVEIYQVPALVNAWTGEQRMIGASPLIRLTPVYQRELGLAKLGVTQ